MDTNLEMPPVVGGETEVQETLERVVFEKTDEELSVQIGELEDFSLRFEENSEDRRDLERIISNLKKILENRKVNN